MDWSQVLAIIGANLVLIIGMIGTVIGIWLHQDKKIDENRKESSDLLRAIQAEIKDFHGRLIKIEEARKG